MCGSPSAYLLSNRCYTVNYGAVGISPMVELKPDGREPLSELPRHADFNQVYHSMIASIYEPSINNISPE